MDGKEPQPSEGAIEELRRRLVSHPRLRQAIMSGITAAIVAEMAALGLQDFVNASQLANAGKFEVSAARQLAIKDGIKHIDCTGGGGYC